MAVTHMVAVVLIPPIDSWDAIQAIRSVRDRAFRRWMPHINLLYPFMDSYDLDTIKAIVADTAPFTITLDSVDHFQHSPKSSTVFLQPLPDNDIVQLQQRLHAAFPDAGDSRPFHPHLTLGQWGRPTDTCEAADAIKAGWEPIWWRVTDLCIIERTGTKPFEIVHRLPLGGCVRQTAKVPTSLPKVVIMSDRTSSMGSFLNSVALTMKQVTALSQLMYQGQLQLGVMFYGDYDSPINQVAVWSGFTSVTNLHAFIKEEGRSKHSGGDIPEAQKTALLQLLPHLDANTTVIHYTDAPPHHPCNMSYGSLGPKEKRALGDDFDWFKICNRIRDSGCHFYTVCNRSSFNVVTFYMHLGPVYILRKTTSAAVLKITMELLQQLMGIVQTQFEAVEWANPPAIRLVSETSETAPIGYLPHGPARQSISVTTASPVSLDTLEVSLDSLSQAFHADADYREMCFAIFGTLLTPDMVMALTYNEAFGTLWRQICKCRDDPRRDSLSTQLSSCIQRLPTTDAAVLREWVEASYDSSAEIQAILDAALSTSDTSEYITLSMPQPLTKKDMMSVARACCTREAFAQVTQLLSNLTLTQQPGLFSLPLSLSDKDLFCVLPHLMCPGISFSLRPAMIMAALAYLGNNALLKGRASRLLMSLAGKWINLDTAVDGSYHVPENFAAQFVQLVIKLDKALPGALTPDEKALYTRLWTLLRLLQNEPKLFTVRIGANPKGALLPDRTVRCEDCNRYRSVTIMASPTQCGLCYYGVTDCSKGPGQGVSHLYQCRTCAALYAVVDTHKLCVPPKCHFCRNFQKPPLTQECCSCGNRYVRLPDNDESVDACRICQQQPTKATVELQVSLRDLLVENGCLLQMFGISHRGGDGSLLKRYAATEWTDTPRRPTLMLYKKKPIMNLGGLLDAIEAQLESGSTDDDCALCFDEKPLTQLQSACGRCPNMTCADCQTAWYSQCSLGNLVYESHLRCPFCKQPPLYKTLKWSNRQLAEILRRTEPFDPGYHYGWCVECYRIDVVCARECARQPPNLRGAFVCETCQEARRSLLKSAPDAPPTTPCPNCGIATYKAGGCNHMTCSSCGAHWCWICSAVFRCDEQVYEHMWNEHGSIGL